MLKRTLHVSLMMLFALTLSACSDPPAPPVATLTILSPAEGAVLNARSVRVRGQAVNAQLVTINGRETTVVGGVWELPVELPDGPATITASARRAEVSVNVIVDASPPRITLESPQRGAVLDAADGDTVVVRGVAQDSGTGLSLVKVQENIVAVDDEGRFSHTVRLQPGLNTLHIGALDRADNATDHRIGVMWGPLTDPTSPINPAIGLTVDQRAFSAMADVVRQAITPALVLELVNAQLGQEGRVRLDAVDFAPLEVQITPRSNPQDPSAQGTLEFRLEVRDATLQGQFTLFEGTPYGLTLSLARAVVETSATLGVDATGDLTIQFGNARLDLEDEDLSWQLDIEGGQLGNNDIRILNDLVLDIARLAFSELLSDSLLEQLYDPGILQRSVTLLGRTLELSLQLRQIIVNDRGAVVRLGITMPAAAASDVPQVPGALFRPRGMSDAPLLDNAALATTDRTALDLMLHGAWRSGLLHQALRGDDFAGITLPFELNAGALATLLDGRVLNHVDSTSPAGITLRPLLPPIAAMAPTQDGGDLTLRVGELHLDLMLGVDQPQHVKLLTLAVFLDLKVGIVVEGATLSLSLDPTVAVDLADEPLFDLDDEATEGLFTSLVALIPSLIAQQLTFAGEADLTWARLSNARLEVHGIERDQLTVGLDISAGQATPVPSP